jgi:hypothetical protein
MDTYESHSKKKTANSLKPLLITGGVVLIGGFSFYGGTLYQKSKTPANNNTANSSYPGGGQNFSGPRRMSLSQVTAITSTGITVTTDGTSKSYTINSDTTISKDGATATAADIAVGDNVAIVATSNDDSIARRIVVNPTFGDGPMMQYNDGSGNVQTN